MNPITSFLVFALVVGAFAAGYPGRNPYLGIALLVIAALVAASLKMANVWQKFVILRMGKLQSVRGQGCSPLDQPCHFCAAPHSAP